jgi:hypothetical protein
MAKDLRKSTSLLAIDHHQEEMALQYDANAIDKSGRSRRAPGIFGRWIMVPNTTWDFQTNHSSAILGSHSYGLA